MASKHYFTCCDGSFPITVLRCRISVAELRYNYVEILDNYGKVSAQHALTDIPQINGRTSLNLPSLGRSDKPAPSPPAFDRCLGTRPTPALLVERTFSTFAGNIPLLVVVCRSKATTRHVAVASHHQSPSLEMPPLLLEAHSWFSQFTQYEIAPNSHTNLKIDGYAWRSFSSSREKSYATAQFPLRRASQSTTSTTTRRVGSTMTVRSFTIA